MECIDYFNKSIKNEEIEEYNDSNSPLNIMEIDFQINRIMIDIKRIHKGNYTTDLLNIVSGLL